MHPPTEHQFMNSFMLIFDIDDFTGAVLYFEQFKQTLDVWCIILPPIVSIVGLVKYECK